MRVAERTDHFLLFKDVFEQVSLEVFGVFIGFRAEAAAHFVGGVNFFFRAGVKIIWGPAKCDSFSNCLESSFLFGGQRYA